MPDPCAPSSHLRGRHRLLDRKACWVDELPDPQLYTPYGLLLGALWAAVCQPSIISLASRPRAARLGGCMHAVCVHVSVCVCLCPCVCVRASVCVCLCACPCVVPVPFTAWAKLSVASIQSAVVLAAASTLTAASIAAIARRGHTCSS